MILRWPFHLDQDTTISRPRAGVLHVSCSYGITRAALVSQVRLRAEEAEKQAQFLRALEEELKHAPLSAVTGVRAED